MCCAFFFFEHLKWAEKNKIENSSSWHLYRQDQEPPASISPLISICSWIYTTSVHTTSPHTNLHKTKSDAKKKKENSIMAIDAEVIY